MPLDDVTTAARAYGFEQYAAGAASRQPEVDDLKAQEVADIQTIADLRAQLAAVPQPQRTVLDVDWTGLPDGPYTLAQHQARFPGSTGPSTSYFASKACVIKSGCLQVTIAANTVGEGPVWFTAIDPLTEATITQDVEFVSGYDFGWGGKCGFGLGGTDDPSINPPTGGAAPTHGWSLTPMWRSPAGGAGNRPAGSAEAYTYHESQSGTWGDDEYIEQPYIVGQVMRRRDTVRLNDVGQSNGGLASWFDGSPGLTRDDYLWRSAEAQLINRIRFAVFRGGQGSQWASTTAGVLRFHRLTITTPA